MKNSEEFFKEITPSFIVITLFLILFFIAGYFIYKDLEIKDHRCMLAGYDGYETATFTHEGQCYKTPIEEKIPLGKVTP